MPKTSSKSTIPNSKSSIPKLRFPEFRGAGTWKEKKLRELAQHITRKNKDGKQTRVLTNSAEYGVLDQRDYFDKDIANKGNLEGYYVVDCGDYVYNPRISSIAPVGPISKNNIGIGVMSPLYTVFRFNDYKNDFYAHYFKTTHWYPYLRQVSNCGARHDRMSIANETFMCMPLPAPAPPEQQKIADCITSLDVTIAAASQKLDALKTHKKGLMQQLFPREGETRPRLRFPEFKHAPGWHAGTLTNACQMQAGKFVAASEIREHFEKGLFPCYGGNGLRGYTKTFTHVGKYPLVGRQGALCGNVKLGNGQFHATEHALVATPNNGIDVDWLFYVLSFLNLNRFATGQAQPGLSVDVLQKIPVVIPEQEPEQHRIANCLTSLDDLITAQTQKLEALKTHKKGLMQQLFPFTGDRSR